jgi:hypothetical protein
MGEQALHAVTQYDCRGCVVDMWCHGLQLQSEKRSYQAGSGLACMRQSRKLSCSGAGAAPLLSASPLASIRRYPDGKGSPRIVSL